MVPETPASQPEDVVACTPAVPSVSAVDPVLNRIISANAETLRKRRNDLGLSPELQVPAPKRRLLAAKLNISKLFEEIIYSFFICINE